MKLILMMDHLLSHIIRIQVEKVNRKVNNKLVACELKSQEITLIDSEELNHDLKIAADVYGTTEATAIFSPNKRYKRVELIIMLSDFSRKITNVILNIEGTIGCATWSEYLTDGDFDAIMFKNKKEDIKNAFTLTIFNKSLVMKNNFNQIYVPRLIEPLQMEFAICGVSQATSSPSPTGLATSSVAPTLPSTTQSPTMTNSVLSGLNLGIPPPNMSSTPSNNMQGRSDALAAATLQTKHSREINKMNDALANKDKELEDLKQQVQAMKLKQAEDDKN